MWVPLGKYSNSYHHASTIQLYMDCMGNKLLGYSPSGPHFSREIFFPFQDCKGFPLSSVHVQIYIFLQDPWDCTYLPSLLHALRKINHSCRYIYIYQLSTKMTLVIKYFDMWYVHIKIYAHNIGYSCAQASRTLLKEWTVRHPSSTNIP